MKCIGLALLFFLSLCGYTSNAQDFITRVKIKFEKKVTFGKDFGNNIPDQIESMPKNDISYYDFMYAGGSSLYELDVKASSVDRQDGFSIVHDYNSIFFNFNTNETISRRNFYDEDFIIKDTIKAIKWKILQDTRMVAGYECRKAIGRIYDSVYIVAFYCEQFVMKAGPEGVQGLPGMILGMAIPQYKTTWFATKIELANLNETTIVPPTKGKKLSDKELIDYFIKKHKEYGDKNAKPEDVQEEFKGYIL